MALLADGKRKQKISIDPRGLNWSQDDDKFGKKMLEKFGWSQGKGLGAQESGRLDHVKLKFKNDSRGVGFSKKEENNWIPLQDDFSDLLANLNQNYGQGETSGEEKVQSLEETSKTSKARLHYQKFTRGKDLSNKKSEDLNCIFGRKKSKSAPVTPQNISRVNSAANSDNEESRKVELTDETQETEHGVTTIASTMSVQDYFRQKMEQLKARRANASAPNLSSLAEKEEGKETENSKEIDNSEEIVNSEESEKKKKKKSKKKEKKDRESSEEEMAVTQSDSETNPRKRKHKGEEEGCGNKKKKVAFTLGNEELNSDDASELSEESKSERKKKKKKGKKSKDRDEESQEEVEEAEETIKEEEEITTESEKSERKKKKKKKEEPNEEPPSEEPSNEESPNEETETKSEDKVDETDGKKKKRKKKKKNNRQAAFLGSALNHIEGYAGGISLKPKFPKKK